mmetsp:Transcript_82197/g.228061  ORF Transcript_82197/g.228061 Transcript_82197/m.228061 type:complete len:216 (-) Transcript_82197:419-1066(-)
MLAWHCVSAHPRARALSIAPSTTEAVAKSGHVRAALAPLSHPVAVHVSITQGRQSSSSPWPAASIRLAEVLSQPTTQTVTTQCMRRSVHWRLAWSCASAHPSAEASSTTPSLVTGVVRSGRAQAASAPPLPCRAPFASNMGPQPSSLVPWTMAQTEHAVATPRTTARQTTMHCTRVLPHSALARYSVSMPGSVGASNTALGLTVAVARSGHGLRA